MGFGLACLNFTFIFVFNASSCLNTDLIAIQCTGDIWGLA